MEVSNVNAVSRILRKLGGRANHGSQDFYGTIAKGNPQGSPRYDESRRDFETVRRNNSRYSLF